ncbi:polymorphic toxin-type HINT domain-containing protein, partial [Micromonospora sp. NPDC050397]|uniref:polymorphic toxin-type HINT domain-containing protein n=1 Tax=Micromonospora sp. NPDC050397 TaxID=3364279 RepID=UPI00384F0D0C
VSLAKRVTELHRNTDKELTDVTVSRVEDKKKSQSKLGVKVAAAVAGLAAAVVLQTTANHPFWDETADKWVDASELTVGHELRTADGDRVVVDKVVNYDSAKEMRDLTVADIHTYYVAASDEAVLVHNNDDPCRVADGAREHVVQGVLNKEGALVGWHLHPNQSGGIPADRYIDGEEVMNSDGSVKVIGTVGALLSDGQKAQKLASGTHTFFPPDWTEEDIMDAGRYLAASGTPNKKGHKLKGSFNGVELAGLVGKAPDGSRELQSWFPGRRG